MNLGLLGGTFDPIHSGHLHMAAAAERRFQLRRIFFIPARRPWQKPEVAASYAERFAMVALALAGKPRWQPLDIPPSRPDSATYAVDEVGWVARRQPEARLFFLIGADAFGNIATWRRYRRLVQLCDFIVFGRKGYDFSQLTQALPPALVAATAPDRLVLRGGRQAFWVAHFQQPANASEIRERLGAGRPLPRGWVTPAVAEYIRRAALYRNSQ